MFAPIKKSTRDTAAALNADTDISQIVVCYSDALNAKFLGF